MLDDEADHLGNVIIGGRVVRAATVTVYFAFATLSFPAPAPAMSL